jgi:peptidoglycan/xylan/chitin deacetylase (PgdA/CDA1 family)
MASRLLQILAEMREIAWTGKTRLLCLLFHDVYRRDPSESGFDDPGADRYKLPVDEFEGQLAGLARVRRDEPLIIGREASPAAWHRRFAITLDDGGVSFYTDVAGRLEDLGWRAHCFVSTGFIGRRGFLDRSQIRELHGRGHSIGSHSVSHPSRFAALPREEIVKEWSESRKALSDVLGEEVTVASVPGGHYAPRVAAAAAESGFRTLFTSEPETRVRSVEGCIVVGRFTVRRGYRADFSTRVGRLSPATLFREWAAWNGKKAAKTILGSAYPRLSAMTAPKRG